MKISVIQFAEFINWFPDAYYFEDTADELWDNLLKQEEKDGVTIYSPKDPTLMIDPKHYIDGGYVLANDGAVDPLNVKGQDLMKILATWLANQTSTVVSFRIPNDKLEQIKSLLLTHGIEPV
jgi:hypothetical protein